MYRWFHLISLFWGGFISIGLWWFLTVSPFFFLGLSATFTIGCGKGPGQDSKLITCLKTLHQAINTYDQNFTFNSLQCNNIDGKPCTWLKSISLENFGEVNLEVDLSTFLWINYSFRALSLPTGHQHLVCMAELRISSSLSSHWFSSNSGHKFTAINPGKSTLHFF